MPYVRTSDAGTEPVTSTELKAHLRIDHTDEDTLIGTTITAARHMAEQYCMRSFITQTWKLYMNDWPEDSIIKLAWGKVISIVGIDYAVSAAHDTELNSSNYFTGLETDIGLIEPNDSWPDTDTDYPNGIEIEFTAGYGAASAVPQAIKNAILILGADLYLFQVL